MMLTGQNTVLGAKTCDCVTFATTNTTWTGLVLNPELCTNKPYLIHM